MIGGLRGIVYDIEGSNVLIDVSGVYYEVFCSFQCQSQLEIGKECEVVVYTDVKEDCIKLYGFADKLEKQVFKLLLEVKGVGTKSASEVISKIDKVELLRAIGDNDLQSITKVKGLGKKTAERILLELKDKVIKFAGDIVEKTSSTKLEIKSSDSDIYASEAILALKGLGFLHSIALKAVTQARESDEGHGIKDTAELVKLSLKYV